MNNDIHRLQTLGDLKKSGYKSKSIKEEIRQNLIKEIKSGEAGFPGIIGYQDTVIPDLKRAILSRHNILLLGLRGQGKTRLARLMVNYLDDYIPIIKGSEINDDPLAPISIYGREMIAAHGDDTEITWLPRSERYVEKLATPDVNIADLIGDIDPIKAANLKLSYADERVIHYGMIPRSHRCIFVINELPDLQPRIQVALFNILQEEDLQIRGFKMRFPIDIEMIFTANPEDYTNRGSIITPLKDRIESQILTHYPRSLDDSRSITTQEARIHEDQSGVFVCDMHYDLIECIVSEARYSEFTDGTSGVSTRMGIAALENLVSTAELRMLKNGETKTYTRLSDFLGVVSAITGKMELVYEGEQEGSKNVAMTLISRAIKDLFSDYFDEHEDEELPPLVALKSWFGDDNQVRFDCYASTAEYQEVLDEIPGLGRLEAVEEIDDIREQYATKELFLHGLAEYEVISKMFDPDAIRFDDPFRDLF